MAVAVAVAPRTIYVEPRVYIGVPEQAGVRIDCQVVSAVVHHGRDDPTSQPVASTLTMQMVGPLPDGLVIGAHIELLATMPGVGSYRRFVGTVTDVGIGWDSVDDTRPTVIATSDIGRIARRMIGDTPWPAELDGDRVTRILQLAGYPPNTSYTDPGTLTVLARDVDRRSALELAQETALDGGGIVYQTTDGRTLYADASHRRGAQVEYEFNACDIGLGLTWVVDLEGLANEVFLRYGAATPQAEIHATEPTSIADRGTYAQSITTRIANVADAQKRADEIIARQADPAWVLGGIEVDLSLLDQSQTSGVMLLAMHDLASVTGLPAGSPVTSAMVWVEGWRETIEAVGPGRIAWTVAFVTSDYCRTAAPPHWDDIPPATTWDSVDPTLTWNGAVCLPPTPPSGRWDDVPASLRWSTIYPQSTTWDQWPY